VLIFDTQNREFPKGARLERVKNVLNELPKGVLNSNSKIKKKLKIKIDIGYG